MLLRNEGKFKKRNKAKKTDFELTVFRPDIIDKMVAARNRLASITQTKTAYTDKDIPGIGKNVLREERRCTAIDAYSFYIEYYCLLGLRDRINEISHSKKADIPSIYKEESDSVVWEHQRGLLLKEGLEKLSVKENLSRLISILEKIAKDALYTKEKDDQRGSAIIPLYEKTYKKAAEDSFIMEITRENSEAAQKIQEIISLL
jgi:hypothetical protein